MTIATIADIIRTHGAERPDAPALEMEAGRSASASSTGGRVRWRRRCEPTGVGAW